MNGLSRRHALFVGLALILIANAIALGGVAFNRSAEESRLVLSSRELALPYSWLWRDRAGEDWWPDNQENSGLSLRLNWRMGEPEHLADTGSRATGWLDAAKLASLGFAPGPADREGRGGRQRVHEVFLVLELGGPVYERGLALLRGKLAHAKELAAAHPGDRDLERRAKFEADQLEAELEQNSRLLAVDAGRDAAGLRERYPDRAHYAIVRGRVRADLRAKQPTGYIEAVSAQEIHVPAALRPVFGAFRGGARDAKFEAEVAFGRRYEPWIVSASKGE